MPFPIEQFPHSDFHSLDVRYWLNQFEQITNDWHSLYTDMITWKNGTIADLETWKNTQTAQLRDWEVRIETNIESFETRLTADQRLWYAEKTADLNLWKSNFETLFNETFSNLTQIKTDAENARDAAIDAAESIESSAEQITINSSDIANIKEQLLEYNSVDILETYETLIRNSSSQNGGNFVWLDNVCTVTTEITGTTNFSANNVLPTSDLPDSIVPGKKYYVKYHTTDNRVKLRIYPKDSSNNFLTPIYYPNDNNDNTLILPSNAARWNISLVMYPNTILENPATVDEIKLLSELTNSEITEILNQFNSEIIKPKGSIPADSDFDDLIEPGAYFFNSGRNYIHAPFSNTYGGTVLVYPKSINGCITQIAYTYSANGNNLTKLRMSLSGTFPETWKDLNGTIYNNTYIDQHYTNTYNITATPEITTDTNNFLASTGDNTDRTGDIQTMLNTTGVCKLGPGKFVITGVEIPNYALLEGCGQRTTVFLSDSVETGYAIKLKSYGRISNLRIVGTQNTFTLPETVGTRHGILYEGTADATTDSYTFYRSTIDNCTIYYFTGGGITMVNTGLSQTSALHISDIFIYSCGAGINIPYFSEFHRITNVSVNSCLYGCIDNGGNNNFSNCDFSGNKTALWIDATGRARNDTHGTFSACTFHHSDNVYGTDSQGHTIITTVGTAIIIDGANSGEIFTGCQIGYGKIDINDSKGIRFIGANILRMTELSIKDSILVTFTDCNFYSATESPITQSGNTTLKFTECYNRDGTVFNPLA